MSIQELFGPIAANDNSPKCERCGASFTPRRGKRFCSDACQRADYADRTRGDKDKRLQSAPEHVCEHCGETFRRRKGKKNAARFCSRECGFAAKSNLRPEQRVSPELREAASVFAVSYSVIRCVCRVCGVRFNGKSIKSALCSEACEVRAYWDRKGIDYSDRTCPECDVVFPVTYGRGAAIYCSDVCSSRHNNRIARWRREARLRAVANDNIDPFYVFNRDGWRCQLCGVRTPKKLRGTYDDRAPELDHIMPISMGGSHTLDNVQCACRKCNGAKSNTPLGQTLLFG